MRTSPDPSVHRQRERSFIQHVERLLDDDRLRIDTTRGRRPVTALQRHIDRNDRAVELKRTMSDAGVPDRELESRMPVGESIELTLQQTRFFFFKEAVGRLKVLCASPTKALVKGETPDPMDKKDVERVLSTVPPPLKGVPVTVVLLSTSGFTTEAHELAERRADRTVVLVEPNDAGGYSMWGPVETKSLVDLFDPEVEAEKRRRIREAIEAGKGDLAAAGVATDRLASRTQLPAQLVEAELKSYARENPGLVAKRLDGRVVLFREGSVAVTSAAAASGGGEMPMIDRLKTLFARKGEHEKKIAFLSERRAALGQQRERAYEEIGELESREQGLRDQFKQATSDLTKRRVTSQLVQLRKDVERRQQLLGVLNQQVNVVSTHLHNLELVQQGNTAKLPDAEEMAQDAAAAEEMLANLEASTEIADSVGGIATMGMSAEEQALYDELTREAGGQPLPEKHAPPAGATVTASGERVEPPLTPQPGERERTREQYPPKRSEPEAG